MLDRKPDDEQVDDFREREERGVEKRDQEHSGAAQSEREALHPVQETLHSPKCRLGLCSRDVPPPALAAAALAVLWQEARPPSTTRISVSRSATTTPAHIWSSRGGSSTASLPAGSKSAPSGCRCPISSTCCPCSSMSSTGRARLAIAISVASMSRRGVGARAAGPPAPPAPRPAASPPRRCSSLNPNLLYLQSTPMTEPLLFATTMVAVMSVAEWVDRDAPRWPHAAGLALTAACTDAIRSLAGHCRDRCPCRHRHAAARPASLAPRLPPVGGWPSTLASPSSCSC